MTDEQGAVKKTDRRALVRGVVVYTVARAIAMTLRVRYEGFDHITKARASHKGVILVTWHGRTFIPANIFRGQGMLALISLSRDGEMQNYIFRRFGFETIRGSTGRGGVRAAIQLTRRLKEGGVLAFTPDGPRGPTHQVQDGTLFLAQRSGSAVIPCGISARPRLLVNSWDRYLVPAPFARASFVAGKPIMVPEDLDDDGKSRLAHEIEMAMNGCEKRAEELLGFGYPAEYPTRDTV